jgi:hypothetical protein
VKEETDVEELPPSSGTPALATLASLPKPTASVPEDILNLGGTSVTGQLGAPTIDVSTFADEPIFSAEGPPLSAGDVAATKEEESATVPLATSVAPSETSATRRASKPPALPATKAPAAAEKKGSSTPLVLGAFVLAVLAVFGLKQMGGETPKAAPAAQEQPAGPSPEVPKVPEQPAPVAPPPAAAAPESTAAVTSATKPAEPAPAAAPPTTQVAASGTPSTQASAKPGAPAEKPEAVAKPAEAKPAAAAEGKPAAAPETKPAAEAKPEAVAKPAEAPQAVDMGGEFDKAAATAALGAAADQASGCRKEGDPSGVAVVHVTFSNAGRAMRATIEGPPFSGTATGGCIAAAMRNAKIPPYGGDRVTVTKRVIIR